MSHSEDPFSRETWDARYAAADPVWSGNPNQRLVEQITGVNPGTALDVGAGEGGDAIWLARQGWQVTALDISPVGLAKVLAHAAEAGVAEKVTTLEHDLLGTAPLPGGFDLVTAHFVHPPLDRFDAVMTAIAGAVGPGGLLLVVGHHPQDHATGARDAHGHADLLYPPEKVVAVLDPAAWDVQVAATPTRENHRAEGPSLVTDTVVLARRR